MTAALWTVVMGGIALAGEAASACKDARNDLSPERTVTIDASTGPIFGAITRQQKEPPFLGDKEVVLTFDDGPMPSITNSILDTLDDFCTKATFFSVGRMALAYPETLRDTLRRGHTVGTHTMTHPFNMHRMAPAKAHAEIERGFAAVSLAAGTPVAPFFRFPGLADSGALLDYLQSREIATFTVDVVSNDSYIHSPAKLASRTINAIEQARGGIVLFHDIKAATAKALPTILRALKDRGYRIVHMVARKPVEPLAVATASVEKLVKPTDLAKLEENAPLPFYGRIGPVTEEEAREASEELIEPPRRERAKARATSKADDEAAIAGDTSSRSRKDARRQKTRRTKRRAIKRKKARERQAIGYDAPFSLNW